MELFGELLGKNNPSKQDYYELTNRLCEIFFDPTAETIERAEQMRPVMELLRRLVSIDHARSHLMPADLRSDAVDVLSRG
jgi:hypothetical protein